MVADRRSATVGRSEENQALVYKNNLVMLDNIEALRGVTPWILKDFRSPRRPLPGIQDFWNRKGLLSENGGVFKGPFLSIQLPFRYGDERNGPFPKGQFKKKQTTVLEPSHLLRAMDLIRPGPIELWESDYGYGKRSMNKGT